MLSTTVFSNGGSQAVRIPKEYRIETPKALITKIGRAVILLPDTKSWDSFFDSLDEFPSDFMEKRNQPKPDTRDITL